MPHSPRRRIPSPHRIPRRRRIPSHHRIPRGRRIAGRRRIRGRGRAALSTLGSLALVLATTPGVATALPHAEPDAAALAAECAPPERNGLSEGIPTSAGYSPTTGTVSALTLFIDFPDAPAQGSTHQRFAEFFPATSDYFATSSAGRMRYEPAPVHRWLRMSQPFASYGIDRGVGWHPDDPQGYNRLLREIVDAVGDEVDFGAHDLVNVLATPEAGPPATEQVLSVSFPGRPLVPTPTAPLSNVSFIWSHQPGETPYRVLVHENGHVFGLPDLYWTGGGTPPQLTGHWDVMEQDWGPSNDLLAWHKWKLDWLTPEQVDCVSRPGTSEHVLAPAGRPGDGTKLVAVRTGTHEVLTLEVRTRTALDPTVCRPGVLVSRVDAAVPTGEGPVRVVDATPNSGGCQPEPHPQVSPELTDATFQPGDSFHDEETGVRVEVLGTDHEDRHRVRVTRH